MGRFYWTLARRIPRFFLAASQRVSAVLTALALVGLVVLPRLPEKWILTAWIQAGTTWVAGSQPRWTLLCVVALAVWLLLKANYAHAMDLERARDQALLRRPQPSEETRVALARFRRVEILDEEGFRGHVEDRAEAIRKYYGKILQSAPSNHALRTITIHPIPGKSKVTPEILADYVSTRNDLIWLGYAVKGWPGDES